MPPPVPWQLNALHERLLEISQQHGLQGVQPEAVSFMLRAARVVSNRVLVAAALGSADTAPPRGATEHHSLSVEDLHDAIRQPAPTWWMAPPSQTGRGTPGHTLGAFNKFVP